MKYLLALIVLLSVVVLTMGCGKESRSRLLAVDTTPSSGAVVGSDRVLYGVYSGSEVLYGRNPQTGEVVNVPPKSSPPFKTPVAAASYPPLDTLIIIWDPFPIDTLTAVDGSIFVWDNNEGDPSLLLVDQCAGEAARIGPPGVAQSTYLQGLAFAPDGRLFGVDHDLFEIDPTNGEVSPIGPLGFRAGAADFDPTGKLYVVELNPVGAEMLGMVNLETGSAATIAPLTLDIGTIGSIVFDPSTGMFLGSGFDGPLGNILFDLDPGSATVSNIRPVQIPLQGMAFGAPCPDLFIDIKPGSDMNPVNLKSQGVIPVAILGSAIFDVSTVDCSTILFGPDGASPVHRAGCHPEDVNGDAYPDLIVHFRVQETGFVVGDTEGCLTALTLDGLELEGCDAIAIVPPGADMPALIGSK